MSATLADKHAEAEGARIAPVLERMVELLGAESAERLTFGEAMKRASEETGVTVSPENEETLLVVAFRIISGRRIPGCPDA